MLFSPVFQCSDDLLVKRKPWFDVLFQNENNTEIWDSQNWKSLVKLALVLHWAIAVLSSVSVLKGKLIGRNILLKVLCYSLSRQRKMTFCLLDSAHIFYYYLFIFPLKRGRNSEFIRIPDWVWESCSISQSILAFRSNSFKTWQW